MGFDFTVIVPLLLCHYSFSFVFGCGVSFFGGFQCLPFDDCPAASCDSGVLARGSESTSFYSAILVPLLLTFLFNSSPNNSNSKSDGESRLQSSRISMIGMWKLLNWKCFLLADQAIVVCCMIRLLFYARWVLGLTEIEPWRKKKKHRKDKLIPQKGSSLSFDIRGAKEGEVRNKEF